MTMTSTEAKIRGAKGGRVGGRVKSKDKAAASRRNGQLGGRERERTLGEAILRCKLDDAGYKVCWEAFLRLTLRERDSFRKFYDLPKPDKWGNESFNFKTMDGARPQEASPRVLHILKKFRLMARFLLASD